MSLYTLDEIHRLLAGVQIEETPFLVLDETRMRDNARRFRAAFPGGRVFFSVKANNHPQVLKLFAEEGIDFDVASWGEIEYLMAIGVPVERMIFSAPTKIPRHIEQAYRLGVRVFAFDSELEVDKLARLAPRARIIARMAVDNEGSYWPLERKFGIQPEEALRLFERAIRLGLKPHGLTFHVGSQNTDPLAWVRALERLHPLWKALEQRGSLLSCINIGGGFPSQFEQPVPTVEEIARQVLLRWQEWFGSQAQLWVEPGRGLVGDAGIMVTTVINRARRNGQEWLYVDAGVFHGLIEGLEMFHFPYYILSEKEDEERIPYTVSGPTCDSADVIRSEVHLPASLTFGDRLYILPAGAYTNSLERYNGIPFPPVILTDIKTRAGV
ncbi:MAG: type III PLP-dependent enzyme [Chloroflexota bacterium]|nr:MAG: ornithine decarboxylase [Bellilinea sp.]